MSTLDEASVLEPRLSLKLSSVLKWNSLICAIAKDTRRMVISLYRSRKYRTSVVMIYLYKSQIKTRMECYYQIWATAAKFLLSILGRVQVRCLVGDELYFILKPLYPITSLSLFCSCYYSKCYIPWSHKFRPSQQGTCQVAFTVANHPHFLRVPLVSSIF